MIGRLITRTVDFFPAFYYAPALWYGVVVLRSARSSVYLFVRLSRFLIIFLFARWRHAHVAVSLAFDSD